MRTLKFVVNGRTLEQDPTCDFSGLFPSADQHIEAEFSFSGEWKHAVKVVAFYSILGEEYPPQVINEENRCVIPPEALIRPVFRMQVLGNLGGTVTSTSTLSIYQKGGST